MDKQTILKLGNSIEIGKINFNCLCEVCNKEIPKGSYHILFRLNFRYYGEKTREYSNKKRKSALGTLRVHFECFDKFTNQIIEANENIKQLKIDLIVNGL